MYLVESSERIVYEYDFDIESGKIANRKTLIDFGKDGPGNPDGLDVDPGGNLWIAIWDGWAIEKYAPDGTLLKRYGVPIPRPTSCVYLGGTHRSLMITSARIRVSENLMRAHPDSGHLIEIPIT